MFTAILVATLVCQAPHITSTPSEQILKTPELVAAFDQWLDAYRRHDSRALALLYSEDADLVAPDGTRSTGRDGIRRYIEESFRANPSIQTKITVTSRRAITSD